MNILKDKGTKNLVSFVSELYKNHPLHTLGYLDRAYWLAFYNGYHYVRHVKNRLVEIQEQASIPNHRSTVNHIATNADIAVARLLKEQPTVIGIPTGKEHKDVQAARCASDLLSYAFDKNERNLTADLYSVMLNAHILGTGYWHIFWNNNLYAKIGKQGEERMKGDWDVDVKDDFDVLVDPTQKKYERLGWCISASLHDIDDLKSTYPDLKKKNITPIKSNDIENLRYGYGNENYYTSTNGKSNKAIKYEYWERPTEKHQKGRYIVTINNDTLATERDNPNYKYGNIFCIPFIPFFWNKTAHAFHGISAVKNQIPLQKEINLLHSLLMMNARSNASVSLAIPAGSGLKAEDFDGTPGIYEYNAAFGAQVQVIGGQPMPGYINSHINTLLGSMQDIAGIHNISMGQVPESGSHIPASGLKMLMDSEAMRNAPTMRSMKSSLKLSALLILKIIKDKYEEPRYMTIIGKGGKYQMKAFKKAQLDGSFDVTLQVSSALSSSPAAKIELALQLWDRGIPQAAEGDETIAAKKVLGVLEFGDIESLNIRERLFDDWVESYINNIRKERKVQKVYIPGNPQAIINRLDEIIMSAEFKDWPEDEQNTIIKSVEILTQEAQMQTEGGQPPPPGGEIPPADAMAQAEAMGQGGMPPQQGMM